MTQSAAHRPRTTDAANAMESRQFRQDRATENGIQVTAWRCDHCRKFQPNEIPSITVYVEDSGPVKDSGPIVKARIRSIQRMIVDPPCARALGYNAPRKTDA